MLISKPFVPVCVFFMFHAPGRMIATAVNKIRIKFSNTFNGCHCLVSYLKINDVCIVLCQVVIIIINQQVNPLVSGTFTFSAAHLFSLILISIYSTKQCQA